MPTRSVWFIRYCLTRWILNLPVSFGIHWVRQYLLTVALFHIMDMLTSKTTAKVKSKLYVVPVIILPNFDTVILLWFSLILFIFNFLHRRNMKIWFHLGCSCLFYKYMSTAYCSDSIALALGIWDEYVAEPCSWINGGTGAIVME